LIIGAKMNQFANANLTSNPNDYISVIFTQASYKGNDLVAAGSVYYNSTACPEKYPEL
jgi:hypothetical protein